MLGRDAIYKWIMPTLGIDPNSETVVLPTELHNQLEEAVDKEVERIEEPLDNIHLRVGTFLEAFVRERLKNMGVKIRAKNTMITHPDYPYITMNIDGMAGNTVEEIKCISTYRMKEFGEDFSDEASPQYASQAHHYMLHPKFEKAYLRVLFLSPSEKELIDRMVRGMIIRYIDKQDVVLGDELVEFQIPRFGAVLMNTEKREEYRTDSCSMNLEVVQNLVDIAPLKTYEFHADDIDREKLIGPYTDMWYRAQHNIPCIPTTLEDCQLLYEGYSSGTSKIAGDLEKRLVAEGETIKARMKVDKKRLGEIDGQLMLEAGDTDILLGAGGVVLCKFGQKYSPTKDEAVLAQSLEPKVLKDYYKPVPDWKKVEKEQPEVFQKCRIKTARNVQWPRSKKK
jgi:hypothetical protein